MGSACTGDDGGGSGSQGPEQGAPATTVDRESSLAAAQAVVLTEDDLGADWHPASSDTTLAGPPERLDELAACLGVEMVTNEKVFVQSPSISAVGEGAVEATVVFTASPEEAERLATSLSSSWTTPLGAIGARTPLAFTATGMR